MAYAVAEAILELHRTDEQPSECHDFDAIYRGFEPRVRRLALRITGDRAAAEDISQDAFVRVLKNLDQFDRSRPMWPWLKTIVTNLAVDHLRSRQRLTLTPPSDQSLPEDGYIQSEDRQTLVEALARVPVRQRAALAMRYLEDWDTKHAAEFLGLSGPALEQLLFRARARLRREYDRGPGRSRPAHA